MLQLCEVTNKMLKYEARVFKMALFFYYLWIIENLNIPIEIFDIFNIVYVCLCVHVCVLVWD